MGDKLKHKLKHFDLEEMKKHCEENVLTWKEMGDLYGVKASVLFRFLQRRGIKRPIPYKTKWKYTINENYFNIIDMPDKAYFLGWLYADGCNYVTGWDTLLRIQEQDIKILQLFNKYLESNRPIKIMTVEQLNKYQNKLPKTRTGEKILATQNQVWIRISNKKISLNLVKLGCLQAKSLILKFPTENQVPSHLLSHFIRGYFEGDGSFSYRKMKISDNFCNFTSTVWFCESLQKIFKYNLNVNSKIRDKDKMGTSTRSLEVEGSLQVQKIMDYIYKDCGELFLDRKYNLYLSFKNRYINEIQKDKNPKN